MKSKFLDQVKGRTLNNDKLKYFINKIRDNVISCVKSRNDVSLYNSIDLCMFVVLDIVEKAQR